MAQSTSSLIAIHGFLGLPSDWQPFVSSRELPFRHWETPNLWMELAEVSEAETQNAFTSWAQNYARRLRARESEEKPLLLGYSLGGRLAMHLALEAPELFCGVILVSAHPGLKTEEERAARRAHDAKWAERFRTESWDSVMNAWNSQGVLAPPTRKPAKFIELTRKESDFDREILARSLQVWSLGEQQDFRAQLREAPLPIGLVSGAQDLKFTELKRELAAGSKLALEVVSDAGHRVPWDDPLGFLQAVKRLGSAGLFC